MIFLTSILHLLGTRFEWLTASCASQREGGIVARGTVGTIGTPAERLVDEWHATFGTNKARFVPMSIFVAKIFRVETDGFVAFSTRAREVLKGFIVWRINSKLT